MESEKLIDVNAQEESQPLRVEPNFNVPQSYNFQPIPTILAVFVQMFAVILVVFLSYYVEYNCINCKIDPYYVTQLLHVGLWLLGCCFDRFFHIQHYKSKIRGYLHFYYTTRWIRKSTFYVLCFGNAFLIVVNIVLSYYCDAHEATCFHIKYKPINILQICLVIESFFIIPAQILYIYHTKIFNAEKPLPDIAQEDLSSPDLPSQQAAAQLGLSPNDYMSELIEKQSDIIRALKNHNYVLARKIYQMQYVERYPTMVHQQTDQPLPPPTTTNTDINRNNTNNNINNDDININNDDININNVDDNNDHPIIL